MKNKKERKMRSLDDLLEEAKWGKLTEEEIAYVVQRIKETTPGNDDDLYTLIHTLGRAQARQYRKLVESFLYYPNNSMISKIALQTLCNYWDFTEDYLDEIKKFIKRVDWDECEDVRLIAISIAGHFLKEKKEKDLLKQLVNIFENPNEDEFMRGCAYGAVAVAMGRRYGEYLAPEYVISALKEGELDLSAIEQAEQLLKE